MGHPHRRGEAGKRKSGIFPQAGCTPSEAGIFQLGDGNEGRASIAGSGDTLATRQTGDGHSLILSVTGSANSAAVLQSSAQNTVIVSETGSGNTFGLRQN